MTRRPPRPTLFPYPTLFRSAGENEAPSSPGPGTDSSMAPSADTKTPPADDPEARRREERLYADLEIQQLFNRSEEHTSELQSQSNLVCRLLLEKKKKHLSSDTGDGTLTVIISVDRAGPPSPADQLDAQLRGRGEPGLPARTTTKETAFSPCLRG